MSHQFDFSEVVLAIKDIIAKNVGDTNYVYIGEDYNDEISKLDVSGILLSLLGDNFTIIDDDELFIILQSGDKFIQIDFTETCGRYFEIREFKLTLFDDLQSAKNYFQDF